MTDSPAEARDYRGTVFLPKTAFPMRGDLPKREPAMLERWARLGLWERLRAQSKGRDTFVLHDGPPYANGNLHIGHALNKILKDVINRAAQMAGLRRQLRPRLGLPRPADRMEGRGGIPLQGQGQGRGPGARLPRRVPRLCDALARRAVGGVPAPGRRRRLGRPLRDDGLRPRGDDRRRDRQVPAEWLALSRPAPGDVVPGREDRAGRGRDRISRPCLSPTLHAKFRAAEGRARRTWSAPTW